MSSKQSFDFSTMRDEIQNLISSTLKGGLKSEETAERLSNLFKSSGFEDGLEKIVKVHMPKGSSEKRIRDAAKPTKPSGAYFRWLSGARNDLKERFDRENPELRGKEAFKAFGAFCGLAWKALSDEEKAPFVKEYEREMVAFRKAEEEYTVSEEFQRDHPEEAAKEMARLKKKRSTEPKKAKSAWFWFFHEKTEEMKDSIPDGKDRRAAISQLWKTDFKASVARAKWTEMAARDKIRYQTEFLAWIQKSGGSGSEEGDFSME